MNGAVPKQSQDFLGLVPMSDANAFIFPSISSSQHSKETTHAPVAAPAPMRPETKIEAPAWQPDDVPVQAPMTNFLDAESVNAIKNAFASLIDLQTDKKAEIVVLNRKTFYTITLQHAARPISVRELNDRLSGLQLCISGVEYIVTDGVPKLSVDFAKKDRFNALAQLEASAKRVRSSPLFGTDELAPVSDAGNKRTKLTKAGSYSISALTGYSPRRLGDAYEPLQRIKQSALLESDVKLLFDDGLMEWKYGEGKPHLTDHDAVIMKTVVEYGTSCFGYDNPVKFRWATNNRRLCFTGYERLNLDQLRGFHDLFPHHIEGVYLDLENGVITVTCLPYLSPCTKPWSSTLFYTKAA